MKRYSVVETHEVTRRVYIHAPNKEKAEQLFEEGYSDWDDEIKETYLDTDWDTLKEEEA